MLGLHPIDWLILLLYVAAIIGISLGVRRRIRNTRDYYQGNRSFGRILTAFLTFGTMTDAGQAASVGREIYRQGLPGIWFANLVLFHTPFQWFIAAWQRRARYIGPGDLFRHRYESRFLAGLYALILLLSASYGSTIGFILTGKTLQAMMVVPEAEYSPADSAAVAGFERLSALRSSPLESLSVGERSEIEALTLREGRGELQSFISYIDLHTFYRVYALLIAAYTILGGLLAIALVDVIQGVLIIFLSLILIPLGLSAIGGMTGLTERVPDAMTQVFGSSATNEYTWYYVAAFALLNLVVNAPKSFTVGGSPKDDRAARIGFVSGSIAKRFMMLGWAFTGLIAIALYAGQVSDPTNIWGIMTRDLLGVGAIGLMIAAIFSANMDGAATGALDASAAVIKNIIEPLRPQTTERQQVVLGRIVIGIILAGTVLFTLTTSDDIVAVFKYALSIGAIVGPAFWMAYLWRRVNTRAVVAQMLVSLMLTIVLPNLIPAVDSLRSDPSLVGMTDERVVAVERSATPEDVEAGRAERTGQNVRATQAVPPEAIYFEKVVTGEDGVARGEGIFRANIWLLDQVGFDFRSWSKAGIGTAGLLFDAILPFILLIIFSLITRPNSEPVLRDFYARINTPALADPVEDARQVQEKIDDPELVEQNKLFPHTSIELWKPTRFDIVGFLLCVGAVLLIIGLVVAMGSVARG